MKLSSKKILFGTRNRGRFIVTILVAALVIAIGYSTVYRAGPYQMFHRQWGAPLQRCDFSVYTAAGRAVFQRQDLYTAHNSRNWFYVYPPPFAIMIAPFALIPQFWASLIWYILSIIMVACAVRRSSSMLQGHGPLPDKVFLYPFISILLISWPLVSALERGQSTPVVLCLVMLSLACGQSGQDGWGGMALGGAILIKVFPILLLTYFAWRRRWRFLAATVASLVAGWFLPCIIYGWQQNLGLWNQWVSTVLLPALHKESTKHGFALYTSLLNPGISNNQSLSAVLYRTTGIGDSQLVATAILFALGAAMILVGQRFRVESEHAVVSAVIVWMLLASPISWAHYFMLLLFPIMVLLSFAESTQDRKKRCVARLALASYTVCCIGGAVKHLEFLGVLCWGTIIVWIALAYVALEYSVPSAAKPLPSPP